MNTTKKIILAALVLILVGAIIFTVTMCRNRWNVPGAVNTNKVTQTYDITENFDSISMKFETAHVSFVRSNNSKCTIVISDNENTSYNVGVKNSTLYVEKLNKSGFYLEFGSPTITVYLPRTEYKDLSAVGSTGEIDIPSTFSFKSIDIEMTTGDISCSASASEIISLRVSTGEIDLESASTKDLYLHASTGTIEVEDVQCTAFSSDGSTGYLRLEDVLVSDLLRIERSTGDVRLDNCDAGEIYIETHTGDISGSLRSEKVFIARSDTGRIDVPETLSGGKCKLISATGDIEITIKH